LCEQRSQFWINGPDRRAKIRLVFLYNAEQSREVLGRLCRVDVLDYLAAVIVRAQNGHIEQLSVVYGLRLG